MLYLNQLHPSLVLRRRLSFLADDVVVVALVSCSVGIVLGSRVILRQHPNQVYDVTGPIYSCYVPFHFRGCVFDTSSSDSDRGC